MSTNTTLRATQLFSLVQFLKICSLFSKEISENLRMKGHFQSKESLPQSNSVPNLKDSIHRTQLTNDTASGTVLLYNSSAA